MGKHTKIYNDFDSFKSASDIMDEFQVLHNVLRNDYIVLLNITEQFKYTRVEFNSMYRSCLIRLFTMIEADIFGLGLLDPYTKVKPKDNFFDTLINTFNQVCTTWDKLEIKEKYLNIHFGELSLIKQERNNLIHPKKVEEIIIPTHADFERLQLAFNHYNEFMNELMNQFYIGMDSITKEQFEEIMKKKEERGITLSKFVLKNTIITHPPQQENTD